jgi:hypothetical protein
MTKSKPKLTAGAVWNNMALLWMPADLLPPIKTAILKCFEHSDEEVRRIDLEIETLKLAQQFWKTLVEKVGESKAKNILHEVMLEERSGRPEDYVLIGFLYIHIFSFGLDESDEKVAKRIIESRPDQVFFASGGTPS